MLTDRQKHNYYIQKAKSSFRTRFNVFLFDLVSQKKELTISHDDFHRFILADHQEILNEYIHVYWQFENVNTHLNNGLSIQDIYSSIENWLKNNKTDYDELLSYYVSHTFKEVFPEEKFLRMLDQGHECHYCHITENQIRDLILKNQLFKKHITRGWTLEIDRKIPYLEYTEENCVICCYWCNNAKTDEFSYSEFKKIGLVIEEIWRDRLKSGS